MQCHFSELIVGDKFVLIENNQIYQKTDVNAAIVLTGRYVRYSYFFNQEAMCEKIDAIIVTKIDGKWKCWGNDTCVSLDEGPTYTEDAVMDQNWRFW